MGIGLEVPASFDYIDGRSPLISLAISYEREALFDLALSTFHDEDMRQNSRPPRRPAVTAARPTTIPPLAH